MSGTLLLLILLMGGLPLMDLALAGWDETKFEPILSVASPYLLFGKTGYIYPGEFCGELGIQAAIWCAFLALASVAASRTWKEKTSTTGAPRLRISRTWRYGGARFRSALKRKFLDQQPVLWLALRDRWLPRLAFLLAIAVVLLEGANLFIRYLDFAAGNPVMPFSPLPMIASIFQFLFNLGLVLWIATQASRIFAESVRNGALELMLVTPVAPQKIVHAQWTALWRAFLVPALCIVLLQTAGGILSVVQTSRTLARLPVPAATRTNSPAGTNPTLVTNQAVATTTVTTRSGTFVYSSSGAFSGEVAVYEIVALVISIVSSLAGLAAVAWFGMWMGLTNQKMSIAVLKTVCFVQVLPWIAIMFAYMFVIFSISISGAFLSWRTGPYIMMIISSVLMGAMNFGKDLFFILWSRKRLLNRFRDAVARDWKHKTRPPTTIPTLPPVGVEPPVIGATT